MTARFVHCLLFRALVPAFSVVAFWPAAPLAAQGTADGPTTPVVAGLLAAKPGDVVDMGDFLSEGLPKVVYSQQAGGPPLIFSDDPEYFRVPEGLGVREEVKPGRVRMYVYHVNGTTESARRISAVIKNLGSKALNLRFLRYASQGPSKNYHAVGKGAIVEFLKSKPMARPFVIEPGAAVALDPKLEAAEPEFDELVHGFYEFEIDQPARLMTLQTDTGTSGAAAAERLTTPVTSQKASGAGRGYFPYSGYLITNPSQTIDTASGPVQLVLADGVDDRWLTGHDSSSTVPSQNKGNYGMLYEVKLDWTSTDGRGLALVTWNARSASQWCGAQANAIGVNEGRHPGGIVEVPRDKPIIKGAPEAVLLQVYSPPRKGQKSTIELIYTPPGASCLPTPIILIPVELPRR